VILKVFFYIIQFLNKKIELSYDKIINPNLYDNYLKFSINEKIKNLVNKILLYQRRFANPNFLQMYFLLNKIHRQEPIKIIHSSPIYLTANIYAFKFAQKNKIPFICTPFYHINPYANYTFYPSYQFILKNSNAVIACTSLEKQLYQNYGIKKKGIHIIPPGIDPNSYSNPNVVEFRKKHGISEDTPVIFFLGRRTPEKGIMQCLKALKILIREFGDIKFIIAGTTTRDYELYVKTLSKSLKNHVLDLGIIDENEKVNALACCDIFVLPSLDDAFGIVYLEAWLFKKPVIGALEGNVAGLIENEKDGYLIPFYKSEQLALKIRELLKNEKKRKELGQNGYDKLINNFTLENVNKQILSLYKKFL